MRIFSDGPFTIKFMVGRQAIAGKQAQIEAFRAETAQTDEPLCSVSHFLDWSLAWSEFPVVAMVSRDGRLCGVAMFVLRQRLRLPVGLVNAGNAAGQGSVIARVEDRLAVSEAACRAMIRMPMVHTVVFSLQWDGYVHPGTVLAVGGTRAHWCFRETRLRLSLDGGVQGTMDRLGYKMRRNIRSYTRRAEDSFGCHFVPDLDSEQRREAVMQLRSQDIYTHPKQRALRQDAALSKVPGAFAVGARDAQGAWLSYVAGWRVNGETQIVWQLNNALLPNASMSTVMRAYLLEHEISRGSSAMVFMGGASPLWSRACEPTICGDLIAVRPGAFGSAARRLVTVVKPEGQISKLHSHVLNAS